MRARIESLRGELEGRQSDAREARDGLRDSERAISDANRALRSVEVESRMRREEITILEGRRAALERSLENERVALGQLLAARVLTGGAGGAPDIVRVALSGEDLGDAARRLYYLGYVSRAVAQLIAEHRAGLDALANVKFAADAKWRELGALQTRQRADREKLLKERRERRRVLERIASEIRSARRQIRVLIADETRLSRLVEEIGKLLKARPGAGYVGERTRVERAATSGEHDNTPFSRLKGRLRLPVRGELIGKFGAPRLSGEGGTPAKGVFIRAAEGDTVRAVATGRVVYADWMRGFGNLLIVDHGENFLTIYGNNESLLKQTGDVVMLGEALATVGASGGNEETGLYFELRHEGRPFDPSGWVKLK